MKKLLFVFFSLVLVACATTGAKMESKSYRFVKYNDWVVMPVYASAERMPVLRFDADMRITGVICNVFNGPADLTDGLLKAQLASTMMFCPDAELNQAESAFYAALNQGATVKTSGNTLTITHGDNTFILERIK